MAKKKQDTQLTVVKHDEAKETDIKYSHVTEFKNGGKLLITEFVRKQIGYLAEKFPSTEWSGILVWEVVSGDLGNASQLVLQANYVFPMDIGSSAYTEYTNGEDTLDMYDAYPDAITMKVGHIHSHHTMTTFFSGTDTDELHNNADKYIAYLSLIVNNENKNSAKLAIVSRELIHCTFNDFNGEEKSYSMETKRLLIYTMEVVMPVIEVEEDPILTWINERVAKLKTKLRPTKYFSGKDEKRTYATTYTAGSTPDIFSTCFVYIPTPIIDGIILDALGIPSIDKAFITALDFDIAAHPLNFANIHQAVFDELEASSELIKLNNNELVTNMMYNSNFGMFQLAIKVVDKIKLFPDGYTKDTFQEIMDEIIDIMVYGSSTLEEGAKDDTADNTGDELTGDDIARITAINDLERDLFTNAD